MSAFDQALDAASRRQQSLVPFLREQQHSSSIKTIASASSSLATNLWELELLSAEALANLATSINELARRSLNDNIFFQPAFLRASLNRLHHHRPLLVCLWETNGQQRKLRAFFPAVRIKSGLPRHASLQNLSHEYGPLGTPLVDRDQAVEAFEFLLQLIATPGVMDAKTMTFQHLPLNCATTEVLKQAATNLGLPVHTIDAKQRAILQPGERKENYIRNALGRKHNKEYKRLLRRLQDRGEVTFSSVRGAEKIRNAFEGFLALEARSWKGKRGTALYSNKNITAFARQAVSDLALRNECEIHSLYLDKQPVASLVCFGKKQLVSAWKIAFDPEYSEYSPGVQIMLYATQKMLDQPQFRYADSLASANHSMIDHLWRERLDIGTVLIGKTADSVDHVKKQIRALQRQQKLLHLAKSARDQIRIGS